MKSWLNTYAHMTRGSVSQNKIILLLCTELYGSPRLVSFLTEKARNLKELIPSMVMKDPG